VTRTRCLARQQLLHPVLLHLLPLLAVLLVETPATASQRHFRAPSCARQYLLPLPLLLLLLLLPGTQARASQTHSQVHSCAHQWLQSLPALLLLLLLFAVKDREIPGHCLVHSCTPQPPLAPRLPLLVLLLLPCLQGTALPSHTHPTLCHPQVLLLLQAKGTQRHSPVCSCCPQLLWLLLLLPHPTALV
jgi:hypothetical protein